MFRDIITSFIIILFLFGCESKDDFQKVIKKLQEQNLEQNKTIEVKKDTKQSKLPQVKKTDEKPKELLVNKEKVQPEKKITELTLKTTDDKEIKLKFLDDGILFENYKGKVVILDIFTTWCPPCIESIPHINQIQKTYKKQLQVIGVLMEEDKKNSEVEKFIKKHEVKYPITNSQANFLLTKTWGGISGYPTIIIFDKNGKYFNHYNGSPPLEMLENDIKKVLKK